MLTIDTDTSTTPLEDARRVKYHANRTWLSSAPENFGKATFSYPSAICYYYARSLYIHFEAKVPIGIVMASVGGSAIEFWNSESALADGVVKSGTCGGSKTRLSVACLEQAPKPESHNLTSKESTSQRLSSETMASPWSAVIGGWTPSCFYNAMIHPLGRMKLRGILWDQGNTALIQL